MLFPNDPQKVADNLTLRIQKQLPSAREFSTKVESLEEGVGLRDFISGLKQMAPLFSAFGKAIFSGDTPHVSAKVVDAREYAMVTVAFQDRLPIWLVTGLRACGNSSYPTMLFYTAPLGPISDPTAQELGAYNSGFFRKITTFNGPSALTLRLNADQELRHLCGKLIRGYFKLGTFVLIDRAPVFKISVDKAGQGTLLIGTVPIIPWHGIGWDCGASTFVAVASLFQHHHKR